MLSQRRRPASGQRSVVRIGRYRGVVAREREVVVYIIADPAMLRLCSVCSVKLSTWQRKPTRQSTPQKKHISQFRKGNEFIMLDQRRATMALHWCHASHFPGFMYNFTFTFIIICVWSIMDLQIVCENIVYKDKYYMFCSATSINPLAAKLFNWTFHPLEVLPRWRDPQLQMRAFF